MGSGFGCVFKYWACGAGRGFVWGMGKLRHGVGCGRLVGVVRWVLYVDNRSLGVGGVGCGYHGLRNIGAAVGWYPS